MLHHHTPCFFVASLCSSTICFLSHVMFDWLTWAWLLHTLPSVLSLQLRLHYHSAATLQ